MRKAAVAATLATGLVVGIGGTLAAQAATASNTSTSTNTLISNRCYHHHGSSTTNFHWVKAANRYEVYASPHHSTTDYNTCHK